MELQQIKKPNKTKTQQKKPDLFTTRKTTIIYEYL